MSVAGSHNMDLCCLHAMVFFQHLFKGNTLLNGSIDVNHLTTQSTVDLLYGSHYTPISGFQGVLIGFLVGIKQILPDQELSLLPSFKIKTKWFPSFLLLLCILLSFLAEESASYLPTFLFGAYMSWIYLRYLQRKPETSLRGDPGDEFSFSSFFPGVMRPVIEPVASLFDRILCGRAQVANDSSDGYTLGATSLPGSGPVEASKRERGARELEERLAVDGLVVVGEKEDDLLHKDAAEIV